MKTNKENQKQYKNCKSCGAPLENDSKKLSDKNKDGTSKEKDEIKSRMYCSRCYDMVNLKT
ncbi:MAG: hypothetical protein GQ557_00660 [Mycoplasmataceae bacterium]|nr:hypothetical protein [Mycoplasmataceae bacterium]